MRNKILISLCFIISFLVFLQQQDWRGWRDLYVFKDMTHDLKKIHHNKLIFGPNPILQIEQKYLAYPRVFCRLLELYEQEQAYDRIVLLTEQIRKAPFFDTWTQNEKIDLLLIAERNQRNPIVKKEIFEELIYLYPDIKNLSDF